MNPKLCPLLLACLALCSTLNSSSAQDSVAEVLLANAVTGAANLFSAGGNLVTSLTQLPPDPVAMPQCQKTAVLQAAGGFPDNWSALTAEQQAEHPINAPIMQLAYTVYQPPSTFQNCINQWGVDSMIQISKTVPQFGSTAAAHVLKVGTERIFVVFKGSDASNWVQNIDCAHTQPVGALFGARNSNVRLHKGFYAGWQVLEKDVRASVLSFLKEVPSGKVYIVGHSLGAALASIAALRLNMTLPRPAQVAGVWLLASPRTGNPTWKALYNALLLKQTLRITNYMDFAAQMPNQQQACAARGASVLNILAPTEKYAYAHVGRSLLMCPTANGLSSWTVSATGSEMVNCPGIVDEVDGSGATHLLGSYFDAWRRGRYAKTGDSLANDPRIAAVLCEACTLRRLGRLAQIAVPARGGGPVTCAIDASCANKLAWDAATGVGRAQSVAFGGLSVCNGFICSDS